jgi:mevalonyl-CoA ligase
MAGSAMPQGLLRRVSESLSIPEIFTNWGMTELSGVATMTAATDSETKRLHTSGRLLPHLKAMIVDPVTRKILPWGKRGEILVTGFSVMKAYFADESRTTEALRSYSHFGHPPDLWMHTGDEAYLDRDGFFVITGRIKDLIIRGGENISPVEIEAVLSSHEGIRQAAVFAVPSDRYGEEVATIVEREDRTGAGLREEDIKKYVRARLARYKAPKYIWWLGDTLNGLPHEWPKTANGKLKKNDLREMGKGNYRAVALSTGSCQLTHGVVLVDKQIGSSVRPSL